MLEVVSQFLKIPDSKCLVLLLKPPNKVCQNDVSESTGKRMTGTTQEKVDRRNQGGYQTII